MMLARIANDLAEYVVERGERAGAKAEATMKTVREIIGLLDN